MQPTLHILSDQRDSLGEGPWWDERDATLYWVCLLYTSDAADE